MPNILDYNLQISDRTVGMFYMRKPSHILRVAIVLKMIDEERTRTDLSRTPPLKLLSIACATGLIEEKIQKLGVEVYGVDADPQVLKEAKARGIITKKHDISLNFPYKDRQFDIVFAGEIIEHLFDTKQFLSEIRRVLKPDGCVIITTPNLARFADRIRFLFGKTPRHTTPIHEYLNLHIRPFTFESLKHALDVTGFTITSLQSNVVQLDPFLKIRSRSRLLAKLFPTLGKSLIVKARLK